MIQGSGRVDKYRHLAYDWLGVDKVELAVMAELLLRGAQTVGELRGRAARMEPIKDLAELRPVLDALQAKGLDRVPDAGRPGRDRDPHALPGARAGQSAPRSGDVRAERRAARRREPRGWPFARSQPPIAGRGRQPGWRC